MIHQGVDVTISRVLRAFGECVISRRSELAFETIEPSVHYQPLPVVTTDIFRSVPKSASGSLVRLTDSAGPAYVNTPPRSR